MLALPTSSSLALKVFGILVGDDDESCGVVELEGDDGEPATGEGVGRKVGLAVGATVGFRSTTVEEVYEATVTKERLSMAFVNDAEFNSVAMRPFQDSAVLYPVLAKDTEMPNSTYHFDASTLRRRNRRRLLI